MRGSERMWDRSSSAERRGESTALRVKNAVVHSRIRRTVHRSTVRCMMDEVYQIEVNGGSPMRYASGFHRTYHHRPFFASPLPVAPAPTGTAAGAGIWPPNAMPLTAPSGRLGWNISFGSLKPHASSL